MRNFLRIYLTCLLGGHLISQNLNVAEHEGIDKTGAMVSINTKVYYFGGVENNCCGIGIYLKGKDKNGTTFFTSAFPSGNHQVQYFGKLISTNDKALFLHYWTVKSCDQSQHIDYIVKLDTNGTILFSVPIQSTAISGFSSTITDITQHPDSSYYLSSYSELYHYSSTGQFISKINTGLTAIVSLSALSNGKLFLHGKLNGNNTNVIILTNGTIIKQGTCLNSITKTNEIANHYYSRSQTGVIEKYDTTLTLVNSFDANISPNSYFVSDFTYRNDSLFVVGNYSPGGVLFYTILDTAFNQLYQDITTYKGLEPTGITLTNTNKVNVISTCISKSTPAYSFSGYFQFKINGTFKAVSDIGIIGFSNLNTWLNLNQGGPITPYLNMDVTVKNFGFDTLKSFYINYYAKYWDCYILLHKYCQNTISPGGTISISTGSFYGQPGNSGTVISFKKLNICVFTSIPNESNDVNIDNDAFCDSLLFTTTGIEPNTLVTTHVEVFPNPFSSEVILRSDVEIRSLKIMNALGGILSEMVLQNKHAKLDLADLNPGIYFIKIETENGRFSKKLVKN